MLGGGVSFHGSWVSRVNAAGDRRTPYFYRTEDGAELELLFELGGQVEMALSRGFHAACDTVEARQAYVVHGGHDAWPMSGNVTAISLVDLMRKLSET